MPINVRKKLRAVLPLWHFELEGNAPFVLDQALSVRRVRRPEKRQIESDLGLIRGISTQFCIEVVSKQSRYTGPTVSTHEAELVDRGYEIGARVIQAMRLFSSGDVGTYLCIQEMSLPIAGISLMRHTFELASAQAGRKYRLTLEMRHKFVEFWRRFSEWKIEKVRRHLNRFMKAYSNEDWYDRLVDYVTSMESLVLPDQTTELRQQFAQRIAWLLGKHESDRLKIFRSAKEIYERRSKVVHGGLDVEGRGDESICRAAEQMNRELLILAMEKPTLFEPAKLSLLALGL